MKFLLILWVICSLILYFFVAPVYAIISGLVMAYAILVLIGFCALRKKKKEVVEPVQTTVIQPQPIIFTDRSFEIAMRYSGKDYPVWIEINNNDMYVYHGIAMMDPGINTLYGAVGEGFLVLKGGVEYRPVTPADLNFIAEKIDIQALKQNLKKANEQNEANTASK